MQRREQCQDQDSREKMSPVTRPGSGQLFPPGSGSGGIWSARARSAFACCPGLPTWRVAW